MKRNQKLFNYLLTAKAISYRMRIILASQSPRRKKLLKQLGLTFEVIPSSIEEHSLETDPVKIVEDLAAQKALSVGNSCSNSFIIGSDTIVVFEDKILGKPKNHDEASKMLNKLSGEQHTVYTGVSLLVTDDQSSVKKSIEFSVVTKVHFSTLEQSEIDAYIKTGSPMDKAGSYGIQDDWGATFVEKIDGDFYNVVGLPINKLYSELKNYFPEIVKTLPINY